MRRSPLTGLGLLLKHQARRTLLSAPQLQPPQLDEKKIDRLWIRQGINPNRQRKGKSGEIPRTGGK